LLTDILANQNFYWNIEESLYLDTKEKSDIRLEIPAHFCTFLKLGAGKKCGMYCTPCFTMQQLDNISVTIFTF